MTCRNTAHNNVHFCDTALPVDDVVVFFLTSLSVNAAFSAGTVCSAVRVGRKFLNTTHKNQTDMDASEVEFLAEKEMVKIIPNFSLDKVFLIGVSQLCLYLSSWFLTRY